jgi:hypothetical protein
MLGRSPDHVATKVYETLQKYPSACVIEKNDRLKVDHQTLRTNVVTMYSVSKKELIKLDLYNNPEKAIDYIKKELLDRAKMYDKVTGRLKND